MNTIKKIRAFFTIKGKHEEMELTAAEINRDGVFLHPVDDPDHTFFVKSNEVDIYINPQTELSEDDVFVIDNEKVTGEANIKEEKEDSLKRYSPNPQYSSSCTIKVYALKKALFCHAVPG